MMTKGVMKAMIVGRYRMSVGPPVVSAASANQENFRQ